MDTNFVEIGKQLVEGACIRLSSYFLYGCLILLVIGIVRGVFGSFGIGIDSTDKDGWRRSGLKLLVDNQTGVNYLSDGKGGLHVRIDVTGKPITGK